MKRLAFATALTLGILAASQNQAQANGSIGFGIGIGFSWSHGHTPCAPACYPPVALPAYWGGYPGYGYGMPAAGHYPWSYHGQAPQGQGYSHLPNPKAIEEKKEKVPSLPLIK